MVDLLEVCIEVFSDRDVAAIVHLQARLNIAVRTDFAKELLNHLYSLVANFCGGQRFVRDPGVEMLSETSGPVATFDQFRCHAAV